MPDLGDEEGPINVNQDPDIGPPQVQLVEGDQEPSRDPTSLPPVLFLRYSYLELDEPNEEDEVEEDTGENGLASFIFRFRGADYDPHGYFNEYDYVDDDEEDDDEIYYRDLISPFEPRIYFLEPCHGRLDCGHPCQQLIPVPEGFIYNFSPRLPSVEDLACPTFEKCSHICMICKPDSGTGAGFYIGKVCNSENERAWSETGTEEDKPHGTAADCWMNLTGIPVN